MNNVDVGWGIVSACNMKCQFCYSSKVREEVKSEDVTLKDWIHFIDVNSKNICSINYGTGENSLLPDWFTFVNYVATNYPHIKQAITTNGTLFVQMRKNAEFEKIVNKGICEIDVSLDFADAERHDELRGLRGAYKNAINMLDYCKGTDIEATLVFIGINDVLDISNLEGLFEIAYRAECKLRTNIFRPVDVQDIENNKFVAKYGVILNALKWIDESHSILYIGDPLFSSILTIDNPTSDPSGSKSIRILSNGDITPSTYLISKGFRNRNIKSAVLSDINADDMGIDFKLPQDCVNCPYGKYCKGGVLDRRYLWYKTFDARDPYCPYREQNWLPEFSVKVNANNQKVQSVHKDYLPTMFFDV